MEIFAGVPNTDDFLTLSAGFLVLISNNTKPILTNYDGYQVSVGASTNIEINKKVTSKLDSPYSNCSSSVTAETTSDDALVCFFFFIKMYSIN